jgi:fucose permease
MAAAESALDVWRFLMRLRIRPPVLLAYAAFVLVGTSAGVSGVLLLALIDDYGVDRATIGMTFFTNSAGFVLAGINAGALIHRFGIRIALVVGGGAYVIAGLYTATRPSFLAFVLVQLVLGYATGMLESALNAYLVALPDATTLLNRLHAFFGVGALLGPVLATWVVGFASWTAVWLILAVTCVPLVVGFLVAYPRLQPAGSGDQDGAATPTTASGSLLLAALREPAVLLGAAMLTVYVGLKLGVGNWGFSYLVRARGLPELLAGYAVSGYWLGLTLGRFLISPAAARIGATAVGMMYTCLAGVAVATILAWLSPVAVLASAALVLLGFFLGPIFPTTMAIAPQLTAARQVPTAIGVMNAGSVVGGAALPWLAGTIAQGAGIWTLLPFTLTLAVLQLAVWWPIAGRIRTPRLVRR